MPAFQVSLLLFLVESHIVFSCYPFKLIDYIGSKQGLCQEAVHTNMQGFIHNFIPVKGCQDDDRRFLVVPFPYFLCYFNAIHLRHLPVKQHKTIRFMLGMLYLQHIECRLPIVAGIRLDPHFIQYDPGVFCRNLFVIDDQNMHILRIKVPSVNPFMLTVAQSNYYSEFCPDTFF